MSSKSIKLNAEARDALKRGIDVVGDAVRATIGPRGRNAAIGRVYGPPKQTNDGVTIAKEIELKDPFENMGASIMKDVAERTNDAAGDGTSTAIVLMQAFAQEGLRHISKGVNVMSLRKGMERAGADVIRELRSMAIPVAPEEVEQVSSIAAESKEVGKIIADTINKVGKNGVVTVEESMTFGIDSEVVEGMEIPKGYISPIMVTVPERMEAEYKEVPVLVTDKKITLLSDILPFLNKLTEAKVPAMVIVCDDIDGEALKTLLFNKLRGGFSVLGIRAPGYGEDRKEILKDIAVAVGAKLVSDDTGISLKEAGPEVLGKARRVVSTKDSTTFVGGAGKKEEIDARVAFLQQQATEIDTKMSKSKLEERIGKLSGGVAILRVGAATEGDMTYLKDKIEDAVNATKAAIAEGIVPGGGTALVKIASKLNKEEPKHWWRTDRADAEQTGYNIVIRALSNPLRQIVLNAGKDEKAIIEWIRKSGPNAGYNAVTDEFVPDMIASGIVDPVKVTRTAVERAVSASAILITTEVAIVDVVNDQRPVER